MNEIVHDFNERLRFSHKYADESWWKICYERAFPTMIGMHDHREDGQHQRAGIDRSIILSSGKTLWIDEKVRERDYGDIILEEWSREGIDPGWAVKLLLCDYIAYAVVPIKTCYLLPVPQMQAAWNKNSERWKRSCEMVPAKNKGYTTISWAIPIKELYGEIGKMLRVSWEEKKIEGD